ncbi:MAG: hypothetical protein HFE84_09260 [Lachnospiraceae bacterium]|nr:hypothetical protein [Lachnospiraceae bacterium]
MLRWKEMNIGQILEEMTRIRRLKARVMTNYYNQCQTYKEPMKCQTAPKSCVFIWPEDGIDRVYFYSSDKEELVQILSNIPQGAVIDYITKDKEDSTAMFLQAGYKKHLEYGRFVIKQRSKEAEEMEMLLQSDTSISKQLYDNGYGEPALVSDAEEIDRQLREKFDPYEAHFYSLEKLREYIKKGWVWVAKENGKVIAANMFEIQGVKSYGAYLYNYGSVEVLSALLEKSSEYLSTLGVSYFYCWMNLANKRILRYNMEYGGYVPDGLYDMIYVKE